MCECRAHEKAGKAVVTTFGGDQHGAGDSPRLGMPKRL
jgi:hypothetical protein